MAIFNNLTPRFARTTDRGFVLGRDDSNSGTRSEVISQDGSNWTQYDATPIGISDFDDMIQLKDYAVYLKGHKVTFAPNDWSTSNWFYIPSESGARLVKGSDDNELVIDTGRGGIINVSILDTVATVTARIPNISFGGYVQHFNDNTNSILAYDLHGIWELQNDVWTQILSVDSEIQWVRTLGGKIYAYFGVDDSTLWTFTNKTDMVAIQGLSDTRRLKPIFNDRYNKMILWSYMDGKFVTLEPNKTPEKFSPTGLGNLGIQSMAYSVNAQRYVIVRNYELYSSTALDGTWSKVTHIGSANIITTIGGRFVCATRTGNSLTIINSEDGIDWVTSTVDNVSTNTLSTSFDFVTSIDGITFLYKSSTAPLFMASLDGLTWETKEPQYTLPPSYEYGQPSVYNNRIIPTGNRLTCVMNDSGNISNLRFTINGATWTGTSMEDYYSLRPISHPVSDGTATLYGKYDYTNDMVLSTNGGKNWTRFTPKFQLAISELSASTFYKYGEYTYSFLLLDDGTGEVDITLMKSTDLETWERAGLNIPRNIAVQNPSYAGVVHNGKEMVATISSYDKTLVYTTKDLGSYWWPRAIFESMDDTKTWTRLPDDMDVYNLSPDFITLDYGVVNLFKNERYYRFSGNTLDTWDKVEYPNALDTIIGYNEMGIIGVTPDGGLMYCMDGLSWFHADIGVENNAYYLMTMDANLASVQYSPNDQGTFDVRYTVYDRGGTVVSSEIVATIDNEYYITGSTFDYNNGVIWFIMDGGKLLKMVSDSEFKFINISEGNYTTPSRLVFGETNVLYCNGTQELYVSNDFENFTPSSLTLPVDYNIDDMKYNFVDGHILIALTEHDGDTSKDSVKLYKTVDGSSYDEVTTTPYYGNTNLQMFEMRQVIVPSRSTLGMLYDLYSTRTANLYITSSDSYDFVKVNYSAGNGGTIFAGDTGGNIPQVVAVLSDPRKQSTVFITSSTSVEQ